MQAFLKHHKPFQKLHNTFEKCGVQLCTMLSKLPDLKYLLLENVFIGFYFLFTFSNVFLALKIFDWIYLI